MSSFNRTQTSDTSLMWEIEYSVMSAYGVWVPGCIHDNYADNVGQALFAFHQWIQHREKRPVDGYRVYRVFRLLRGTCTEAGHTGEQTVVGKIGIDEWPKDNPVTPSLRKPEFDPRKHDETSPMEFMAEMPVLQKPDKRKKHEQ